MSGLIDIEVRFYAPSPPIRNLHIYHRRGTERQCANLIDDCIRGAAEKEVGVEFVMNGPPIAVTKLHAYAHFAKLFEEFQGVPDFDFRQLLPPNSSHFRKTGRL